jgi:hypothetical protein
MASLEVLPSASRGISNDNGMFLSQVKERDRKRYVRIDDDGKANMTAPAEAATWFRLVSVPLENDVAHPGAMGDEIGVATRWQLPGVFADNPPDALARVQPKIDSADWGYDPRSGAWAGKAIAAALDRDLSDEVQKKRCKVSDLPQFLSITAAQLLHANLPQYSPLRKKGDCCCMGGS